MSIGAINNSLATTVATSTVSKKNTDSVEDKKTNKTGFNEDAVVYEKSDTSKNDSVKKTDHAAIIEQLKLDADARKQQLINIVQQTISRQGKTLAATDDIWKFLASGDFTVTPEVKAQAQKDIADDGYWGVEQTSDRILDFAKALANDDPSAAPELLDAFKKGFEKATNTWGKELPEISKKTYDAVLEKFDKWVNEGKTSTDTKTET
ncbi:hypothetical protein [Lachnobacterium bovis]|uniref:hypothetical protein n=1 Tax=Lachnobacterium bovis TaxID=140626 RepID=UPI00048D4CC8|nr:hypothetical protein [Lachnobacterium bovis]